MKYDIVVYSTPYTPLERLPWHLGNIKGFLNMQNVSSFIIDGSVELCKYSDQHSLSIDDMMLSCVDEYPMDHIKKFINDEAQRVVKLTDYLHINMYYDHSTLTALMLAEAVKKYKPEMKILIGGEGIRYRMPNVIRKHYNHPLATNVGNLAINLNIADDYVIGDEEFSILNFLNDKKIDSEYQIASYENQVLVDYDDLDLDYYTGQVKGQPVQIPVKTSKGCIKKCDFCVYSSLDYSYRGWQDVAKQLISLTEKYKKEILMLDYTVNGNMKEVKSWVNEIAEYNKTAETPVRWAASGWVCRRPGGLNTPEFFDKITASGCQSLNIGIESGSDHVLKAMNKQIDSESIYYELEQMKRAGIHFVLTFVHGHWSERWEDLIETAKLFARLGPYTREGLLGSFTSNTFTVKKLAPVSKQFDKNKIQMVAPSHWWTELNPELTGKERFYRTLLMLKLSSMLNIPPTFHDAYEHEHKKIKSEFEKAKEFYKTLPVQDSKAEYYYNNFDEFLEILKQEIKQDEWELDIDTTVIDNNSNLKLIVMFNNKEITLPAKVNPADLNKLSFKMIGKTSAHTEVSESGEILKDAYIRVNKLTLNGWNLLANGLGQFFVNDTKEEFYNGFWINESELVFEIPNPFEIWYSLNSNENQEFPVLNLTYHTPVHRKEIDNDYYVREMEKLLEQL